MMEEARPRLQRDRFLAGIDQIPIFLADRRRLAKIQDTVFGVEDGMAAGRLVLRDEFGDTDPEIDVGTVFDVLCRPPGNLLVGQFRAHT
jgi:hypothetical protein